jgi:hypothetical protein
MQNGATAQIDAHACQRYAQVLQHYPRDYRKHEPSLATEARLLLPVMVVKVQQVLPRFGGRGAAARCVFTMQAEVPGSLLGVDGGEGVQPPPPTVPLYNGNPAGLMYCNIAMQEEEGALLTLAPS